MPSKNLGARRYLRTEKVLSDARAYDEFRYGCIKSLSAFSPF